MTSKPSVAVFDYGIGNLRSAEKALQFVGANATLTSDEKILRDSDGVVLPGVGAFGRCVEALEDSGLFHVAASLAKEATQGGKPFLGICVGMQLLYKGSDESSEKRGLGIIEEQIQVISGDVKIPQMQWNKLRSDFLHPMFAGLEKDPWVYFVHSYAAPITEETIAFCDYGTKINAAVATKNLWATQFHPEKSGNTGLLLLKNFLNLLRAEK